MFILNVPVVQGIIVSHPVNPIVNKAMINNTKTPLIKTFSS